MVVGALVWYRPFKDCRVTHNASQISNNALTSSAQGQGPNEALRLLEDERAIAIKKNSKKVVYNLEQEDASANFEPDKIWKKYGSALISVLLICFVMIVGGIWAYGGLLPPLGTFILSSPEGKFDMLKVIPWGPWLNFIGAVAVAMGGLVQFIVATEQVRRIVNSSDESRWSRFLRSGGLFVFVGGSAVAVGAFGVLPVPPK